MDWKVFHIWAEEAAMWSTLGVNAAIMLGGFSAAAGSLRKLPRSSIVKITVLGSFAGIFIVFVIVVSWIATGQAAKYQEQRLKAEQRDVQVFRDYARAQKARSANEPNPPR